MILRDLFGETSRIKILEELLTYSNDFLTAEEISRMADVSSKTVYIHLNQLSEMGIVEVKKDSFKRFRLNSSDERVMALGLIETSEYLRQSGKESLKFESIKINENTNAFLNPANPSDELSLQFTISKWGFDMVKEDINILIPENLQEFHIDGGAIASSSKDIRLLLFAEELEKNNKISNSNMINLVKTAKTEIIMSPIIAKQIRDLITMELEKYDFKD